MRITRKSKLLPRELRFKRNSGKEDIDLVSFQLFFLFARPLSGCSVAKIHIQNLQQLLICCLSRP